MRQPAPELVLTRVVDAPRNVVFEAWSKPEHVVSWWGPKGFTLPTYLEVVPPSHVVFTSGIDDDPSHQVLTRVTFAEEAGQTTIIVHQTFNFESEATRCAPQGWTQSLDRLTEYLSST